LEDAEEWWERSERAAAALEEAATPEGQDTVEIVEEIVDAPVASEDPEA
jgi:hypothetical protein